MEYLTIVQVARQYQKSRETILKWIQHGYFPNARLNTFGLIPFWEIPASDLLQFNVNSIRRGRPPKK